MTERKPTCVACKGVGGGGTTYTAGAGIVIESNEISADTSVLATKSELPDMDDYQPKLTAGDGIDITNNVISCAGFVLEDSNDWTGYLRASGTTYEVTEDILIIIKASGLDFASYPDAYFGSIYLPKGYTFTSGMYFSISKLRTPGSNSEDGSIGVYHIELKSIFTSSLSTGSGYVRKIYHELDSDGYINLSVTKVGQSLTKGSQIKLYKRA